MHFYNSTNPLQREVVFGLDKDGIVDIAVNAAKLCRKLEHTMGHTEMRYEYSPESFTLTEPEFAIRICHAVMDVIEPTPDQPLILNLPATVECYTPNVYGDVIEWFGSTIRNRDCVVISLHPHNDRGARVPPPSSVCWPVPIVSRARCSATASEPATSTLSTWRST